MIEMGDKVKPLRGRNKGKEGEVRAVYKSGICYVYFGVNNYSNCLKNNLELVEDEQKKRQSKGAGNS